MSSSDRWQLQIEGSPYNVHLGSLTHWDTIPHVHGKELECSAVPTIVKTPR